MTTPTTPAGMRALHAIGVVVCVAGAAFLFSDYHADALAYAATFFCANSAGLHALGVVGQRTYDAVHLGVAGFGMGVVALLAAFLRVTLTDGTYLEFVGGGAGASTGQQLVAGAFAPALALLHVRGARPTPAYALASGALAQTATVFAVHEIVIGSTPRTVESPGLLFVVFLSATAAAFGAALACETVVARWHAG